MFLQNTLCKFEHLIKNDAQFFNRRGRDRVLEAHSACVDRITEHGNDRARRPNLFGVGVFRIEMVRYAICAVTAQAEQSEYLLYDCGFFRVYLKIKQLPVFLADSPFEDKPVSASPYAVLDHLLVPFRDTDRSLQAFAIGLPKPNVV